MSVVTYVYVHVGGCMCSITYLTRKHTHSDNACTLIHIQVYTKCDVVVVVVFDYNKIICIKGYIVLLEMKENYILTIVVCDTL